MSCAHPITIHNNGNSIKVPCGQCMNCRVSYQQSLLFSASNELLYAYKAGYGASFCCFTYSDDYLPENGSLRKRDLQLFIKRLRSNISYKNPIKKFKYIACGEYGDSFGRAHYHAVFIGLTDYECSKYAKNAWIDVETGNQLGLYDIQPLGRGGMRYVSKYCTKQIKGKKAIEMYDKEGLERPFLIRSVKMGYQWLNDNYADIIDKNYCYIKNGKLVPIPKYYRNILDKNKEYDKTNVNKAIKMVADTLDMSVDRYKDYVAKNTEKMLIQLARADGMPVDDYENIVDKKMARSSPLHRMVENILDPIPF